MDLLLYGFGGLGYSVAEIAIENGYKKIGVFDDSIPQKTEILNGEIIYFGKYDHCFHSSTGRAFMNHL